MARKDSEGQKLSFTESRRSRVLSFIGRIVTAIAGIAVIGGGAISREIYYLALGIGAAGAVLTVIASILNEREREEAIQEKEAQIVRYEAEPLAKEDLISTLRRHIKLAVHREEVSMLRAEARANNLFGIGRAFLIASILGPVVAALLYWWIDPVAPETLARLKDLHQVLGAEVFKGVTLSINRDWRILLAGVSFGLLFLAAARGLLNQQAKEAETYFKLGEKVNFFERLDSVLSIRAAHPDLDKDSSNLALAELVFTNLLHRDIVSNLKEPATRGDSEPASGSLVEEFANVAKLVKESK